MTAKPLAQTQAAELTGVTVRRLQQLDKDPSPPLKDEDSQYPCKAFGQWLRRRHIAGLGITNDGEVYDYEAERARLTHHQANNAAMDEEIKRGNLIPSESVDRVWSDMIAAFRARMLSLPPKAAQVIMAAVDVIEAESILKNLVHEALAELSDYDPEHYRRSASQESSAGHGAATGSNDKPVGGRRKKAQQRSKRGTGPVEH